jgi:chaperonin cofactor prefoldin
MELQQLANPTIMQNLTLRKKRLEQELVNVDAALNALERNPEVAECIERVSKVL